MVASPLAATVVTAILQCDFCAAKFEYCQRVSEYGLKSDWENRCAFNPSHSGNQLGDPTVLGDSLRRLRVWFAEPSGKPMGLIQKNPRAHKIKLALPPPPQKTQNPPPHNEEFYGHRFSCRKNAFFPGVHKIGAAISGPRIADTNFTDTRIFLPYPEPFWKPIGRANSTRGQPYTVQLFFEDSLGPGAERPRELISDSLFFATLGPKGPNDPCRRKSIRSIIDHSDSVKRHLRGRHLSVLNLKFDFISDGGRTREDKLHSHWSGIYSRTAAESPRLFGFVFRGWTHRRK